MTPPEATTPTLCIQNLSIQRGKVQILRDISWTMQPGEHWAILGSNGCGKTSLLSAITAYLSPSSGTVEFMGHRYGTTDWSVIRNRIGVVSSALSRKIPPQESALEVVLSGEFSQLGFWSREPHTNDEQALSCLSRMGVSHLATRRWEILSQGERQKVFIARALMANPALLILDEPCAGLDPVARERFLNDLSLLAHSPDCPGLVLVTHHVEEVFAELTHVLVLKDGGVLASGEKETILNSTQLSHAFGAELQIEKTTRGRWHLTVETV